MINKLMLKALKALSYPDINVRENYELDRVINNLTHPNRVTNRLRYDIWDRKVAVNGFDLTVRVFMPKDMRSRDILLFFHGGGWVSGNVNSYTKTCANLSDFTGRRVLSLDYRLAPEFPFPFALYDCYEVAKALHRYTQSGLPIRDNIARIEKDDPIVLVGDSAGGNLAAAVSLLARDRGEFAIERQVLIYPLTYNDHSASSPYPSAVTNGSDYLLTSKKVDDYMALYIQNPEDRESPYLAPLLCDDLSGQPDTLILTAEYDPLRDEGEAFGKKLRDFGNNVAIMRMTDTLHGFFSLPLRFERVERCYNAVNKFLDAPFYGDFVE